jgi:putative cell wall-binding protein
MSKQFPRQSTLLRGLCAVAAVAVTVSIVMGLDAIADHSSAATVANNANAPIVVAQH